jgi:formylglycine-generating enzyme required for sulfatase activity
MQMLERLRNRLARLCVRLGLGPAPLSADDVRRLRARLGHAGLEPDTEELADLLWLMGRIARPEPSAPARTGKPDRPSVSDKGQVPPQTDAAGSVPPSPTDEPGRITQPRRDSAGLLPDAGRAEGRRSGVPVRSPRPHPLPDALEIGRALRPLHRRVASRRERRLDEETTVNRYADQGVADDALLIPVLRPARERRYELLIIVDLAASMRVWSPMLREFYRLVSYNGAFRRVRLVSLDSRTASPRLHAGLGNDLANPSARPARRSVDPVTLAAPERRRAVLVLSDCVAPAWHTGAVIAHLRPLAAACPLALMQMLPPRIWPDTALGYGLPTRVGAVAGGGLPTRSGVRFRDLDPLDALSDVLAGSSTAMPDLVPILTLEASTIRAWSKLLAGHAGATLPAVRFEPDTAFLEPTQVPSLRAPDTQEIERRLQRFFSDASPQARTLSGLVAAVPLTLDVMRLVQQTHLPESGQLHLAELLISGLLRREPVLDRSDGEPFFDFHPGVRRALLDLPTTVDSLVVLRQVSARLGTRFGHALDFAALLELPGSARARQAVSDLSVAINDLNTRHFAGIAAEVLARLGGRYARIAAELAVAASTGDFAALSAAVDSEPSSRASGDTQALDAEPRGPTPFRDRFADDSPGPEMVWLPGGLFTMGSPEGVGEDREHPAHRVQLSHYAVGRFPVTVGEFRRFIEATGYVTEAEQGDGAWVWNRGDPGNKEDASWRNPYMDQDDNHPVICISWNDAKAYCDWLSEETGQQYGLLSEAQWEYACRAGEQGRWCFGDDEDGLDDYAWYGRRSGDGTHPIGTKRPNAWQLHDMHGNVWEWCTDWFDANTYKERAARIGEAAESRGDSRSEAAAAYIVDPTGPETGSVRVVRGGSWGHGADLCRSAFRIGLEPSNRDDDLGFRLSRTGPLHSYPFTLDRDDKKQEKVPAYLTGLQDTLGDGGQAPAMVWLRGGQFRMGQDDSRWDWEKPAHPVEVSAFSIGQYPLTFDEYDRFCEATKRKKPGDRGWGRGRRPVINISWGDAQAYCNWLNGQQKTGTYRLLTEAEWEFACRAGSDTRWSCGNDEKQLGEYAWYGENAQGKTHPVGEKKPNAWQLHDMHGNIWEWCADWFDANSYKERAVPTSRDVESSSYSRSDAAAAYIYDPTGPETGSGRVVRGGSWDLDADNCRSACRSRREPSDRLNRLGFRLSRTGPWPSYPFTLVRDDEGASEQPDAAQEPPTPQAETFAPQQGFRDRFVIVRKDGRAERADVGREGPEMVYLPGGTFLMGDEQGNDDEKPVHRVALDAFAMGRTPVTWGEYRRFCEDTGSHWPKWLEEGRPYHLEKGIQSYYIHCGVARDALDLPVVGVAWDDAVAYCAWLAERTDRPYRLPTEAEWEYACRAGTKTRWSFGDDEKALDDYGWYRKNAQGKLHPVGQQRPNPWGLLDMHGNVWEWCADWYAEDAYKKRAQAMRSAGVGEGESAVADRYSAGASAYIAKAHDISTEDPSVGSGRVVRGGSWGSGAGGCRSACRDRGGPSGRGGGLGFRLSRTV